MHRVMLMVLLVPLSVAFAGRLPSSSNGKFLSSKLKRDLRRELAGDVIRVLANGAGPGTALVDISGESLSLGGYHFPAQSPDDVVFVDGWEVVFSELLVTVDRIWLANNPDLDPSDQSRTGDWVALLTGPWALDLHKGGPIPGIGGPDEQAQDFATFRNQNLVPGNPPFDPTVRYAFGYETVPANLDATLVNIDPSQYADYQYMIDNGMTVLYVGTATWRGTSCQSTDPSFDFSTIPTRVTFRLGWRTPTAVINCQNPSLPGPGIGGEEHPRGVQFSSSRQIITQLTIHTDHPFWENFDSDGPPAHFDQFAAVAQRQPDGSYLVNLENTYRENYTAFPVPWRWCTPDYTPPDQLTRMDFEGGRYYDPTLSDPLSSFTSFRDYYDLTSHVQSSQGHLNSNGLCALQRGFPSLPGF